MTAPFASAAEDPEQEVKESINSKCRWLNRQFFRVNCQTVKSVEEKGSRITIYNTEKDNPDRSKGAGLCIGEMVCDSGWLALESNKQTFEMEKKSQGKGVFFVNCEGDEVSCDGKKLGDCAYEQARDKASDHRMSIKDGDRQHKPGDVNLNVSGPGFRSRTDRGEIKQEDTH